MSSLLATGLYWLIAIYGVVTIKVIRSYYESKPPGLQTFLGKVIVLFTYSFVGLTIYVAAFLTYVTLDFARTITDADSLALILTAAADNFFVGIEFDALLVVITKYLSVYKSQWIFALNEQRAIRFLKLMALLVPLILTILEFTLITNPKDAELFRILKGPKHENKRKVEVTKAFMSLSLILATVLLQLRLEYDNFRHGENPTCCLHFIFKFFDRSPNNLNQDSADPLEYKMSILRLAACFLTIVGGIVNFLFWSYSGYIDVYKVVLLVYVFLNVVMTTLSIYNHEGLRKYFISRLCQNLKCFT